MENYLGVPASWVGRVEGTTQGRQGENITTNSFTVGSLVGGGGETGRRQYGSRAVKSGQTAEVGSNLGIEVNAQGKTVD